MEINIKKVGANGWGFKVNWALPKTRSRARSALRNPVASRCAPALNLKIPPIRVSIIVMDCKKSFLKLVYKVLFGPRWLTAPRRVY